MRRGEGTPPLTWRETKRGYGAQKDYKFGKKKPRIGTSRLKPQGKTDVRTIEDGEAWGKKTIMFIPPTLKLSGRNETMEKR